MLRQRRADARPACKQRELIQIDEVVTTAPSIPVRVQRPTSEKVMRGP